MSTSLIAIIFLCFIGNTYALRSNFTCDTHYPPEYFKKYYPLPSKFAGWVWNVTCRTWTDSVGNQNFVRDPEVLRARQTSQFADGGILNQFFVLNGSNLTYTGNVTVRATPSDGQYSPMSMCVVQTPQPADFSSEIFQNTYLEVGANMATDQYINKFDTTAPAFWVSQTEFFAISLDGKRFISNAIRWDPATAKTTYMLTCIYRRAEKIPESIGNWWEEPSCCQNN